MFKFMVTMFLAILAGVSAKPGLLAPVAPVAYTAPAPAAAVVAPIAPVTATSSQVIARNYNGVAHAPVIAPVAAAAYTAPIVAPAHPVAYAAAPFAAYTAATHNYPLVL